MFGKIECKGELLFESPEKISITSIFSLFYLFLFSTIATFALPSIPSSHEMVDGLIYKKDVFKRLSL